MNKFNKEMDKILIEGIADLIVVGFIIGLIRSLNISCYDKLNISFFLIFGWIAYISFRQVKTAVDLTSWGIDEE